MADAPHDSGRARRQPEALVHPEGAHQERELDILAGQDDLGTGFVCPGTDGAFWQELSAYSVT